MRGSSVQVRLPAPVLPLLFKLCPAPGLDSLAIEAETALTINSKQIQSESATKVSSFYQGTYGDT
jgi:hypothetical protein